MIPSEILNIHTALHQILTMKLACIGGSGLRCSCRCCNVTSFARHFPRVRTRAYSLCFCCAVTTSAANLRQPVWRRILRQIRGIPAGYRCNLFNWVRPPHFMYGELSTLQHIYTCQEIHTFIPDNSLKAVGLVFTGPILIRRNNYIYIVIMKSYIYKHNC